MLDQQSNQAVIDAPAAATRNARPPKRGNLVISRRSGETLFIDVPGRRRIYITAQLRKDRVRLICNAEEDVRFMRSEIADRQPAAA